MDSQGSLWIGTANGLARLAAGKITAYGTAQGLSTGGIHAVCAAADGTLWAGGDSADLSVWNGSSFTVHHLQSVPAHASVRAIARSDDGTIWIGTTSGLVSLRGGQERRYATADGLADNAVFCLAASQDGALWIGTKDGFSRLRNGEIESFRSREGLSQSTVFALCEDREGTLWVGTKHGLNQFLDRRMLPFTKTEGLASNDTGPVFQDRDGIIWVGTQGAGLSRFDGHRFTALTTQQGLASNTILALAGNNDGDLWAGTDKGLNRLRDGRVEQTYTTAQGLPADGIRCLLSTRQGVLWAGTSAGLAALRDGRFIEPGGLDKPLRGQILALFERRDGSLMASMDDGSLYSYRDGRLREVPLVGAASANIDAFHEDAQGRLWMGTMGGGLRLLDGEKVFSFSVRDGLFDDEIYGIVAGAQDRLWMACSKGIFYVARDDLLKFARGEIRSITTTPFSPTDALRIIECRPLVQPSVWRLRDGQIWFSTIRGIVAIDPDRFQRKLAPPPVVIEDVIVDGKSESAGRIAELPPGRRNLEFRYTGLSFTAPTRMTFRYRLEGFDKDWIDAGTRREAFYTNLPPGKYRFLVAAFNVNSTRSSSPASVAFSLAPHYYQRPWFLPLCASLVALAAWLAYRRRIRRVRQRLALILVERSRIARELHDTLLQGFSGVTMEMQALRERLATEDERVNLDEIIRDAANCMREARRSVAGLRGGEASPSALTEALAQLARQLTEMKDIRLRLHVQHGTPSLPAEIQYNVLRIAQEAIANAVAHSGANCVDVSLTCDAEFMELRVTDDGAGFDSQATASHQSGHYGLIGMRERASQIGGELGIDSGLGRGTQIVLRLPVKQAPADGATPARVQSPSAEV